MARWTAVFLRTCLAASIAAGLIFSFAAPPATAKEIDPPEIQAVEGERSSLKSAAPSSIPDDELVHAVGDDPIVLDPALAYDTSSSAVLI